MSGRVTTRLQVTGSSLAWLAFDAAFLISNVYAWVSDGRHWWSLAVAAFIAVCGVFVYLMGRSSYRMRQETAEIYRRLGIRP